MIDLKHVLNGVEEQSSAETVSQLEQTKLLVLFVLDLHLTYIREKNLDT